MVDLNGINAISFEGLNLRVLPVIAIVVVATTLDVEIVGRGGIKDAHPQIVRSADPTTECQHVHPGIEWCEQGIETIGERFVTKVLGRQLGLS